MDRVCLENIGFPKKATPGFNALPEEDRSNDDLRRKLATLERMPPHSETAQHSTRGPIRPSAQRHLSLQTGEKRFRARAMAVANARLDALASRWDIVLWG
jgi:hypothetical protein